MVKSETGPAGSPLARRAAALAELRLDDRQLKFVECVARGFRPVDAAKVAGYDSLPHSMMQSKAVRLAISLAVTEFLKLDGAPAAINLLINTVRDDKVNLRIRVDAAKTILDRAGYSSNAKEVQDNHGPADMQAMSTDELRDYVTRLEGELAGRAKPVETSSDTVLGDVPGQVIDFLED